MPNMPNFKSIAVFCPKSKIGVISPPPRQWLRGQNTSAEIGLIELTKPSDTLSYKPFLEHCILQTTLHVFLLFIFEWNKIVCSKS